MEKDSSGNRPTFSLVFLTWNSEEDIPRTLDSTLDQTYPHFEVIVVDNDSQDRTVPLVREKYASDERIRVVENDSNLGFTRGINRGIEETGGDYICCYNDDTYFPPDYLESLAKFVSPATVWTTARINHRVSSTHCTVRLLTRHRFPIPYVVDSLSGTVDVNYVPGDGLVVPREIYEQELDGMIFDPRMPDKGEDMDLSLRLLNLGIPMKAVLDTYSIHPDEGFYSPSIENGLNHLKNVYARFRAYRENGYGLLVQSTVLLSSVSVPIEIYLRAFPRVGKRFQEETPVEG